MTKEKDNKSHINYRAFPFIGMAIIGAGVTYIAAVNVGIGVALIGIGAAFIAIGLARRNQNEKAK